jgi:hypothetical protein
VSERNVQAPGDLQLAAGEADGSTEVRADLDCIFLSATAIVCRNVPGPSEAALVTVRVDSSWRSTSASRERIGFRTVACLRRPPPRSRFSIRVGTYI